jgi:5-methylcytosine-specific restriction endonuclease McrA
MDTIINTYQLQGHTVRHFTSDDEANLKSTLPELLIRKISYSSTPAGLHEKKSERSIQTLKYRLAAIKAGLSYVLPTRLEYEAVMAVVDQLNSLPTTNTGNTTALEAFSGRKPTVPAFAFGTIGVVYHPRQNDKTLRGEIGIFLTHGYHRRYIKGFLPTRDKTYSVRQMTPLREQVTPLSWNYPQNIRGINKIRDSSSQNQSTPKVVQLDDIDKPVPPDSNISTTKHSAGLEPTHNRTTEVPNQLLQRQDKDTPYPQLPSIILLNPIKITQIFLTLIRGVHIYFPLVSVRRVIFPGCNLKANFPYHLTTLQTTVCPKRWQMYNHLSTLGYHKV